MTINSKKKGNLWENKLANWLKDNGIKAWKDSQSGGGSREKGDVGNNINMTMESKAAKSIKLMDWWAQVKRSADMHHNSPVLFIHQDGMPPDRWLVVMDNYDWLDLVKGEREDIAEQVVQESPQLKWAIKNALEANKKLLKMIEE